nr:MAG TPA: hypothetical protein [Caudoviricetes sp.]
MIKVKYEGVYLSTIGQYKRTIPFKFEHEVAGNHTDALESHLKKRYTPMMIAKTKGLKEPFERLVSFRLIDYEKNNKPNPLTGKDLFSLNEWELQELARTFNLFEIPLPFTTTISELKQKAAFQYLKRVKGLKIDTDKEKMEFDFFKKDLNGSWIIELDEPLIIDIDETQVDDIEIIKKKKSLKEALGFKEKEDIKLPDADEL